MIHNNINISNLIVHARRVKESRTKRKDRHSKRERVLEGGATKNRIEIQDKPKFKKRFSNQVQTKYSKARD